MQVATAQYAQGLLAGHISQMAAALLRDHIFWVVTVAVPPGRHAPGTLKASVMGLVDDEVTLVMTDIEGSTSLWEW